MPIFSRTLTKVSLYIYFFHVSNHIFTIFLPCFPLFFYLMSPFFVFLPGAEAAELARQSDKDMACVANDLAEARNAILARDGVISVGGEKAYLLIVIHPPTPLRYCLFLFFFCFIYYIFSNFTPPPS